MRGIRRIQTINIRENLFLVKKKVPLSKVFTICTTDAYVVDILRPYLANKNDAKILKTIIEELNSLS